MKLHGIGGVGTGKLGSMVYSVRNGQQIVRQYNPIVNNPSTEAQVAVRSKMKLMSQLAAIVAPVIAISADGLKTKRNEFISRNYQLSSFGDGQAVIDLANVQLTKSNTAMIAFEVDRSGGSSIAIHLKEDASNVFDRVVYSAIISQADGSLRLWDSILVTEGGAGGLFPATLPYTPNAIAVYGYGIRANNDAAKAAYANLKSSDAGKLAQILTSRNATLEAVTISETKGAVLEVGENAGESNLSSSALVEVATSENGTVTGGGRFTLGSQVTITATPNSGWTFEQWTKYVNDVAVGVSTENPLTFTLTENVKYVAQYDPEDNSGDTPDEND